MSGDMTDTDSTLLLADPTHTTCLAAYLNAAMASDTMARIAYQITWGVEWAPIGNGAAIFDGASTVAGAVR